MGVYADYVGVQPEGMRHLAASLDAAYEELVLADLRIAALLGEAGVDPRTSTIRTTAGEWIHAADDIRRRAAVVEEAEALDAVTVCVVPWWDPIRRAVRAVMNNARNAGAGAVESTTDAVTGVWQLTPANDEWRQEWVSYAGVVPAAIDDPGAAVEAAFGLEDLEERGWSYWLGGFVPDLVGGGIARRTRKTAGDLKDPEEVPDSEDLPDSELPGRGGDGPGSDRPAPDPVIELEAWEDVVRLDEEVGGHNASRHGAGTTLEQQHRRALTGINPDGTVSRRAENASRFLRWQDQRDAIEDARRRFDGSTLKLRVTFDHVVGEGYMKNTLEYRETAVVVVKFNPAGEPYSSYPDLDRPI